ncbi:hypothetical protein BDR26DRAFT_850096 [Obelidium mucronatum]|nr:hypothetical protein BDR26DRAFT_850096 [Obelidium mucronatum]
MSNQKHEIERLTQILRDAESISFSSNYSDAPANDHVPPQPYDSDIEQHRISNSRKMDSSHMAQIAALRNSVDSLESLIVNLVKGVAVYKLVPRSLVWRFVRDGLTEFRSDLGHEMVQYMNAVQGKEQPKEYDQNLLTKSEDFFLQIESLKSRLENEKRAHKILKRDFVTLETSYSVALSKEQELIQIMKQTEDRCKCAIDCATEAELRISNEMLERSRAEYKLLNETFAKVNESNQKNIMHLKTSLGLPPQSASSISTIHDGSRAHPSIHPPSSNGSHATMMVQRLEAELKFSKDRYEADIASFRKLNDELQQQLTKVMLKYERAVSQERTNEDWMALQKALKLLETQKQDASKRMSNLADTLETTAHKYTILSDNYDAMTIDMKRLKENSGRLKSIVQAKDAIIDDLHGKTEAILEENSSLKVKLKNALATIAIKTNLFQDLKTKFDAVLSKVDPIQKEAAQSEKLRDKNQRLGNDLRCKEIQLQEWKRKFNDMEILVKSIATTTSTQENAQELESQYNQRIKSLQKSLTVSEQQVSRLESGIRKSLLEIFQNREQKQNRINEFGCVDLSSGASISPDIAVQMSRLSKEFFGVGLYDIMNGSLPTKEDFTLRLKETLTHAEVDKQLPKLVADLCGAL